MKKIAALFFLILTANISFAQQKMKTIEELIGTNESAWIHVKDWIDTAKNKVEILPCDSVKAKEALYKTQVSNHSPMGAIIYSTGGLLIDNGWLRILGSGNEKMKRSLPGWNKGKSFNEVGEKPTFLLIADDAVGGFFAINGGKLGNDAGKIYYLSPDKLQWEPLDLTYSEFLDFCFNGNLTQFYGSLRWTNWKEEVSTLDGDKVYHFMPYLWSKEGKDINKNKRSIVPAEEQYQFNISAREQLGLDK
jgi:hypothetical protein